MRCVFVEVVDRGRGQENLCSSELPEHPATSACRSGIYQPWFFRGTRHFSRRTL